MAVKRVIPIFGQRWTIKEVKGLYDGSVKCDGLCESNTHTISIEKDLKDKDLTLMHEFIHASFYEIGLNLGVKLEEQIADQLSRLIVGSFSVKLRKISL